MQNSENYTPAVLPNLSIIQRIFQIHEIFLSPHVLLFITAQIACLSLAQH
jgi:hypothetical protein